MKKMIWLAALVMTIMSCSSPEASPELATLIAKRDSLGKEYQKLGQAIADVEKQIAEMDTTKKAPAVTIMKLSPSEFNSYFLAQGSVQTDQNVMIFPEASGILKKLAVKEGQRVNAGQLLARVDDAMVQQQLTQVNLNLDLAKDLLAKQQRLWDQKIGSEVDYLQAKNNVQNLEKQIDLLKEQASNFNITAPFSGVVDQVDAREGELVSPMSPIMRLVNLSDIYMKADISENYLKEVREGAKVDVIIPNMDTIQSTISRVGSFIKPENRTFEITVNLPGNNSMLKPNLVGMVRINDYQSDSTIVLPSTLIMRDAENRQFVFALDETSGKPIAKKTIIETGNSYSGKTEIISGLTGTETIIEKGARKLIDGQEVRIQS